MKVPPFQQQSAEIMQRMGEVRSRMPQDVDDARRTATELTDWRHYVRRSPWMALAATAVAAYMMVPGKTTPPKRVRVRREDEEDSVIEPAAKASLLATAAGVAYPMLVRAASSYAIQRFSHRIPGVQKTPSTRRSPASGTHWMHQETNS